MKRLFTQFSFPGGIPSHVAPETPGSIHEGGELGYALSHALRRRLRQPRPDRGLRRRRRRSRDGPAGDQLAFEQVPEPGHRRRGPADPAPERLQDRQPLRPRPHQPRGAGSPLPRLRLHALLRRGARPGDDASAHGRHARHGRRRDPAHQGRRAPERLHGAPALADDRPAHAQGLDVPQGDRRQAHRGLLAIPPGADGRDAREPGPRAHPRRVDEELPARGALRRRAAGSGPSWPRWPRRASAA